MRDGTLLRAANVVVKNMPPEEAVKALADAHNQLMKIFVDLSGDVDALRERSAKDAQTIASLTQRLSRLEKRPPGPFEVVDL